MAMAVFSTAQQWAGPGRGVQLFGTCEQALGPSAQEAERSYAGRFRAYASWKSTLGHDDLGREYRFYRFRVVAVKILDEESLGDALFVRAALRRDWRYPLLSPPCGVQMRQKSWPSRNNGTIRAAAKITLFYLVLSIAWIVLSDRFLLSHVHDPDLLTRLQTYKGWAFVFATSVLIFFVIWKVIDQLRLLDLRRLEMRRRANHRLRRAMLARNAARRQMEAVFFHASDGIVVISGGGILLANRQAEKFFGADPAGGSPAASNDRILALLPELGTISGKQDAAAFDLKIPSSGREDLILNAAAAPLFSRRGESIGTVVVLRDVSRERHYDALKSRFIANAGHELKTPLTAVMGYSEVLKFLPGLPEEAHGYAGIIHVQAQALARIVDDLLDVGHVETGVLAIANEENCDLSHLLQIALDRCRTGQKDRLFRLEVPGERVSARCDPVRISQVMENLLDNAVKFSSPGAPVRIAVSPGEEHHRICVSDRGIGMPPDVIARAFDRFYRADMSDTAPAGLGLGLSIAQGIVTAHGGRIWVESEPGQGTTVCFTVPRSF